MKPVLLLAAAAAAACAEPLPEDRGAAGLWQTLRKLGTTARVLHLTAHPDDEDGGTITLLSRGLGAHVTLLSLTRGESGANLVSGDFFDALGALRTLELQRAAQFYGAEVRFTRFIDFGYSKNVAETFRNWDREAVLDDLVRLIRQEQPHIILSRFEGSPRDGHGNHEAAGALALPAFDAAGDPTRFPEHIRAGLRAWRPLKLYAGSPRDSGAWTVRIDSGVRDPVLGRSYAQMAREGLRAQRSQGAGSVLARPGPSVSFYKLVKAAIPAEAKESSILDGLDVSLRAHPHIAAAIDEARAAFSVNRPEACVPALARALAATRERIGTVSDRTLALKEQQISLAIAQALGVTLEALVEPKEMPAGPFALFRPWETFQLATPGQTFTVMTRLHGAEGSVRLDAPAGWTVKGLGDGRFLVTVPVEASPTAAYWRRDSIRDTRYRIEDERWLGQPLPPLPLVASALFRAAGADVTLQQPVEASVMDALGVQQRRTLLVAPAVSVRFQGEAGILPAGRQRFSVTCIVKNHTAGALRGDLRLTLPPGWRSEPPSAPFAFERENEESSLVLTLLAPPITGPREYAVEAVATVDGKPYRHGFQSITQPGLETLFLHRPAVYTLRSVRVDIARDLRVGYVMGTGDEVPLGLRQLGANVEMLDTGALASGDLSRYHTIVLGIRAYAVRHDVRTHNSRLLDYVRRGGVLVVQYNTPEFDNQYGPYPYTMGRNPEEISEEDSPVRILAPEETVFRWPNAITASDFDGWVEQRGSKFWTTWDAGYKPLLSTQDAGQEPQLGGWLQARYGQGLYVYCAYAWYRQLPYAVPGAARLVANLVSLGSPDSPWRQRQAAGGSGRP